MQMIFLKDVGQKLGRLTCSATEIEAIKQELELIVGGQVNRLVLCLHEIKCALL